MARRLSSKRAAPIGAALAAYYEWASIGQCCACREWTTELHHVHGVISPKTGVRLAPRSGIARAAVIRACPPHHRTGPHAIHAIGEADFGVRFLGGADGVLALALSMMATYLLLSDEAAP